MSDFVAVGVRIAVEVLKAAPLFAAYFIGKWAGRRSVVSETTPNQKENP